MEILDKFGIVPNDIKLYEMAFTHKSIEKGNNKVSKKYSKYDYERLEFLGDSVLNMIASEYLYKKYETEDEGKLTKLRSNFVCLDALVFYSNYLGLNKYVKIGEDSNISFNEAKSIQADIFESFLGAIYLDQGIDKVREFLSKYIAQFVDKEFIFFNDYKSKIKEYCDAKELSLQYKLYKEYGDPHDKTFIMDILINNKEFGQSKGKSKKEAEQAAAFVAIKKLGI
ncbi:MAG: ribonuclease III [Methanobacteriaceae archaeon]